MFRLEAFHDSGIRGNTGQEFKQDYPSIEKAKAAAILLFRFYFPNRLPIWTDEEPDASVYELINPILYSTINDINCEIHMEISSLNLL